MNAFVRAAYYFGEGWPINCWSAMNPAHARADFERMRMDGFNTVILLLPWRGFQRNLADADLNPAYVQLLEQLLAAADGAGLGMILRLSYAHHICDEAQHSSEAFTTALLADSEVQAQWQDYLARIHVMASAHQAFRGAFISWEEFWGTLMRQTRETSENRRRFAERVGYDRWLDARQLDYGEAVISSADQSDFAHYHRFANERLRELFDRGAQAFPGLGYQVRVDKNAHRLSDGRVDWLENDDYLDAGVQRYTYWGPFIGAENSGEALQADQALFRLRRTLDELSGGGRDRSHIIEQFNFIDDTFKYAGEHAALAEEQVHDFLREATPLLLQQTGGYGIWAWRDYHQNALVNPLFLQGLAGWTVLAGAPRLAGQDQGVVLSRGDVLAQHFSAALHGLHARYPSDFLHLAVALHEGAEATPRLQATLDGHTWVSLEETGQRLLAARLPTDYPLYGERGARFALRCLDGGCVLRKIDLYQHTYRVGFREVDGRDGPRLQHMLYLNAALQQVAQSLAPAAAPGA